MGNVMFYCASRSAITCIRVIRAEGEVLEFRHPVMVKHLVKVYPGHSVVHCSQLSRTAGRGLRGKVKILRAEDWLSPGQTYCLLRMPSQIGKASAFKPPAQDAGEKGEKGASKNCTKATSLRGKIFGATTDMRVCDSESDRQLQQRRRAIQCAFEADAANFHHYKQPPPPPSSLGPWRPLLDSIIESPLHASMPLRAHHIVTMSPLARQGKLVPAPMSHAKVSSRLGGMD